MLLIFVSSIMRTILNKFFLLLLPLTLSAQENDFQTWASLSVSKKIIKKTDLVIQVKPTIVKDNYSGIVKQYYHDDAEKRLIVADPSKLDSTLIDSSLIK